MADKTKTQRTSFLDEAIGRREAIAAQLAHLDEHDDKLRESIERNAASRADLLHLDRGYRDAIVRMTPR